MSEQIDPTGRPSDEQPGASPVAVPPGSGGMPTVPPPSSPALLSMAEVSFRSRTRAPDLLRVGVVLAAGLAVLLAATIATGASPVPSTGLGAGASPSAAASPGTKGDRSSRGFGRFGGGPLGFGGLFGRGGPGAFNQAPFGRITITAIAGSQISLKTDDGWTRTITVSSSTAITKGGAKITAADLKVGDTIRLRQTRNSDGTFTIAGIDVLVPQVAGTVTGTSSSGFTVKDRNGVVWTVTVGSTTVYRTGSGNGSKSDVTTGVAVVVAGTQSGNSISAATVFVRLPTVVGKVTAKSGSDLTIQTPGGTTITVHVSGSTSYRIAGKTSASLSDITVGSTIVAQGTQRADGSLDASTIAGGQVRRLPVRPKIPGPSASPASAG